MMGEELILRTDAATIDRGEAHWILDQQVDVLHRLNNEMLRAIRIHALLVGALLAGVYAVGGVDVLLPRGEAEWEFVLWSIFTFVGLTSGVLWVYRLASARVSYSELKLAINPSTDEDYEAGPSTLANRVFGAGRELQRHLFPLTPNAYETEMIEHPARPMYGADYRDCIEKNYRILHSREAYVNAVQRGLNVLFVLTVFGVIGMMLA